MRNTFSNAAVKVTATTSEAAWSAAADVLLHSLQRGDFDGDSDSEDTAARVLGALSIQWSTIDGDQPFAVTLPLDDFDAALSILVCDTLADTVLYPAISAIGHGIRDALYRD